MSNSTGRFTKWRADWHRMLEARPGFDYFMIRSVVFLLVGIGAVMVMSSTMTWSVLEGATVWNQAMRQFMMIAAGLAAFWIALRTRPETVRRWTPWLVGLSLVLLVAVLIPGIGTGRVEVGSQSWIVLGPLRFQPSELAKVAIAVWGASYLADRRHTAGTGVRSPFIMYTGVAALMALLIGAQGDLGMAVNFAVVVGFTLLFAGVDMRLILTAVAISVVGLLWVFFSGGFRSNRFHVYFDALFGRFEDTQGVAFQSTGLPLPGGRLRHRCRRGSVPRQVVLPPEAKNDFISPSSARSSDCGVVRWSSSSSPCSGTSASVRPSAPRTSSSRSWPVRSPRVSCRRPSSTSATSSVCCRSPASSCR